MGVGDAVASAVFLLAGLLHLAGGGQRTARRLPGMMFLLFSAALTLHSSAAYTEFDAVVRSPNLADLICHLLGLAGIATLTVLLLQIVGHSQRWRTEVVIATIAAGCAVLLFALSRTPVEAPDFTAHYRGQWTIRAYWLIPAVYGVACLSRLFAVVRATRGEISRIDVRIGLEVAAYGGLTFGIGYIGLKAVQLFGPQGRTPGWAVTGQDASLVLGMLCLATGFGAPLVTRLVATSRRQSTARIALVRLRRLRSQLDSMGLLGTAVAGLSSGGPYAFDVLCRDADTRLYRRVVEIRDALLLLHGQLTGPIDDRLPSPTAHDLSLADLDRLHGLVTADRPATLDLVGEARALSAITLSEPASSAARTGAAA